MTYFFFVLALFVGLLYYTIFPSDQIKVIEKPRSEQTIISFLAQHHGAVDYIKERLNAPFLTIPHKEIAVNGIARLRCEDIQGYANLEREEKDEDNILYLVGSLPNECQDDVFDACPNGVDSCSNKSPAGTTGFVSALICLNADNQTEVLDCAIPKQRVRRYVVTYGYDQYWWWEESQGTALWRDAIWRRSRGSFDCGIVQIKDSEYKLLNTNGSARVLPKSLITGLSTLGVVFESGRTWGDGLSPYPRNTLLCLTPVNEPYETDDLIVSLDSALNSYAEEAANKDFVNLTHRIPERTDGKPGWVNLASQQTHEHPAISTDNLDVAVLEHFDDSHWTTQGVIFNGENATYPNYTHNNLNKVNMGSLGNSFTISYTIQYADGVEGTFGAVTTEGKGLKGGYIDGDNLCFNVNPIENSPVCTALSNLQTTQKDADGNEVTDASGNPVMAHKPVHITYIVDYDKQKLSVNNGTQIVSDIKPFTIFGNSDDEFYIGKIGGSGEKLKANLYNFRIYNRALNETERTYNYESDKQRYHLK